ncbi:MAG: T9SS type A sorting domain-containing protein, partial [Ignavibacteriaceae bacterium]|nr:T9SS type A sorting domain-containing protein [Ignavibacteriaceae bacterium]
MKNLLLLVFLLSVALYPQYSDPTPEQLFLEEHGSNDVTDPLVPPVTELTNWNPLPAAPNAFGRTIIGAIGEYVYIFASQNASSMAAAYHIPSNSWVASTPCQFPAYNSAYCVAKGELYKFSGTGATSNFEKFTPTAGGLGTWTTLTATTTSLMNAQSAIVYGGDNYIYAYSSGISSPYPSYFSRFHLVNQTWENVATPQYARRYAGMAAVNGNIYLIGGLLSDGTSGDIAQKYDIAANTWSVIAPVPEVLNFTKWTVTEDGRYVYLLGSGGGYSSGALSSNVYYYDPSTNTWALESICPAPRGLATGVILKEYGKVFWGGGNDGSSGTAYQSTVWEGVGGPYIPVELLAFSGVSDQNGVTLNWSTATETNNRVFHIERKKGGDEWTRIGNVQGSGTVTYKNDYSFTDHSPVAGVLYYRLSQEDFDGTLHYVGVTEVNAGLPQEFRLGQNYPNPFNPATTISFSLAADSKVSLKVYDILGNEVMILAGSEFSAGTHNINFDASSLTSGVYLYR